MGFARMVLPVVERFAPDLIVVVAGQDAAAGDPLSDLMVTEAGFRGLAGRVRALTADSCCDGRMLLILESGYNRSTPTAPTVAIVEAQIGAARCDEAEADPPPDRFADLHRRRLDDIAASLRPYWPLP